MYCALTTLYQVASASDLGRKDLIDSDTIKYDSLLDRFDI